MAIIWLDSYAADVIRQRVEDYGWSDDRLARLSGLSLDEISSILIGEDHILEESLQKILEILDLDMKDLKNPELP